MKLALWVARHNRPFSIVEDPELVDIFSDLNSHCVTPGRRTLSRDIKEIFVLSQKKVAEILQVCLTLPSDISRHFNCFFCRITLACSTLLVTGGHRPTLLLA